MARLIDFDAARAERTKEPLLLRAYGQTFELPGSLPAALFLDIVALEEAKGAEAEVTFNESLGLLQRVFPAKVLDQLLESDDFSVDDFTELAGLVVKTYMTMPGQESTQGNSPAPNRAARRHPATPVRGNSRASSTVPKPPTDEPGDKS
jgi:hypothetical protein